MFSGTLNGDSPPRGGRIAAIKLLGNPDNLNLKLYLDDKRPNETGQLVEKFYCFRDRVQEVLHDVEVLIDYQAQDSAQDGYRLRLKPNISTKNVVGFDFWDVAKPDGPIRQRAYSLRKGGHGWFEYIRSIKATTIFGNKFGELIQAENPDLLCPNWKTVPTGMDYMSTSIATLKGLQNANKTALDPGEITSHVIWCSHCKLFSQCGCLTPQPGNQVPHLNPVQFLLPKGQKGLLDVPKICMNISLNDLGDHGAVVFSHAPYKIVPRKKEDKSGNQKERKTGGVASAGSSRSEGTPSPSTQNNTESLIPSIMTTTQITQPTTGLGASGNDGSNEGGPRDKGKRQWSWLKVLRSTK